jgi:hypothetical protein
LPPFYSISRGVAEIGGRKPKASIPYAVEAWVDVSRGKAKCPSEDFLIPLNHLDSMEPILIRGGA